MYTMSGFALLTFERIAEKSVSVLV